MKTLRERLHQANGLLAPYAVPHPGTLGRAHKEPEDDTRFPFQRDRDRIIHTQAFRRLKGKTQVFVTGEGDHYRTRLTHTMEVAQISRDIARTLQLNEDLAEAIALAHDLGHPPFGHAGEEALDHWARAHGCTFEHNEQSERIVTLLEVHTSQYPGLNLNLEVLEGIRKHRTVFDQSPHTTQGEYAPSIEAQVVNLADEIAYTCHDCDDGLRACLFTEEEIGRASVLAARAKEMARPRGTSLRGALIDLLVHDLYENSEVRLKEQGTPSLEDVYNATAPILWFSSRSMQELTDLRGFLWDRMYCHPSVTQANEEGKRIILGLCDHLLTQDTPKVEELQKRCQSSRAEAVKDYVAGMTDHYAKSQLALRSFSEVGLEGR
jgi:dGTPase